ncbi:MAG: universal stress protein [Candidatus Zixiibacteriota bacterium]
MLPYKRIICPTDFSKPSYKALKVANELALHFSAELILVHVISPIPIVPVPAFPESPGAATGFDVVAYQKEFERAARKKLKEAARRKVPGNIRVQTVIEEGNAADEIGRIAQKRKADLIVIATHGETGWRHLIFGSVAERVVRHAPCSVLTVLAPRR